MSTVIKVENLSKLYHLGEVGTGLLAHDVNRCWHRGCRLHLVMKNSILLP